MLRFRARAVATKDIRAPASPLDLEEIRTIIDELLQPGHFFLGKSATLEWERATAEVISWEVFHGRLLDPAHASVRRAFEAWNIFWVDTHGRSTEPILSVKLDVPAGRVHVVRAIYCHAWEGYHGGDNVYLSREVPRWVRELVGSIELARFPDRVDLHDELICLLFRAVVGISRLPLTSVEAPLPAFSLGELAYFHRPDARRANLAQPLRSYQELVATGLHDRLSWLEKVKLLETFLHVAPLDEIERTAGLFVSRWHKLGQDDHDLISLVRSLFNETALSPYTDLVDKTLGFLSELEKNGSLTTAQVVDLLGHLLRHSARHLTAYDLVIFHHRGANYPDALLLDAALKAYLKEMERRPDLFIAEDDDSEDDRLRKRLRRRALRQGWLLRRFYEGHAVPDAPTSPGENARILPAPHVRVPEEQILNVGQRSRRLFAGDSLSAHLGQYGQEALRQSVRDLEHPHELRELGMALFLDRPLGLGKAPGESDQTLLFSYEAFSRSIAERRLRFLAQELGLIPDSSEYERYRHGFEAGSERPGISLEDIPSSPRPGAVSLADARQAADDFVFLRTTSSTVKDFLSLFDFTSLAERCSLEYLTTDQRLLILAEAQQTLVVHDAELKKRLELRVNLEFGYTSRAGTEYPTSGLLVTRFWQRDKITGAWREQDVRGERLILRPRE